MIIRASEQSSVSGGASKFCREMIDKLPLADAALSLWSFVMDPDFLLKVFADHRGRSFEDVLTFPVFVELIADALLQHQGSGRQAFTRAHERGELPGYPEAMYGKLRRVPLTLSQGFFEAATERLRSARPDGVIGRPMPASLDEFTVVVVDGKILKNVAKRLMASRGKGGKLYGSLQLETSDRLDAASDDLPGVVLPDAL